MSGYILEHRKILESEIWHKPPMYFKVWHYLLLKAQYQDYKGLKRGQLFTTIDEIREACSYNVGYRKITPSKKEIWGIIEWLRTPQNGNISRNPYEGNNEGNDKGTMIVTTKVTHGMIVTICNFNKYQNPKANEGNNEGNDEIPTKELRRERQGNNNNKEKIKNNKNKEYIYSVSERVIGRLNERTGKHYSYKTDAWLKLISARIKNYSVEDLISVVDKKCDEWLGTEMEKYLRPQTLFNATHFEDYLNQKAIKKSTGNPFLDILEDMK